MEIQLVNWQYCKNPNEISKAIINQDPNWEGLKSAKQIISINYDTNHEQYIVFWRVRDEDLIWR